ncbi:phage antirepressor KilAC domain-containing protein [Arhodomonas sp. AD133]|uniref:phage antirepressor KilAC domain-containing protein n=1 Tax=Arhodomonas sp. AD133 TaxID=3415009 RepID=UPI003EB8884B
MANTVIPFEFERAKVRVVQGDDGEPWFVARDVAQTLGYSNVRDAISKHCKGGRETRLPSAGGEQAVKIIPERDVYRLIMRSKLPSAERFEEWVVGEVLPQIRKTGGYGQRDPVEALNDPETLRKTLLTYTERVMALEQTVQEQAPKVEAHDRIAAAEGSMCITDAAKHLQVRPKDLFDYLQRKRWIYRRQGGRSWLGYQQRVQQGLLVHKVTTVDMPDGGERVNEQVRITPKGLHRLSLELSLMWKAA